MPRGGNRKTLKSWVNFVKHIQRQEGVSYSKAMKIASKRKHLWRRGGDASSTPMSSSASPDIEEVSITEETPALGGRRRRHSRRRRHRGGTCPFSSTMTGAPVGGTRRHRRRRS